MKTIKGVRIAIFLSLITAMTACQAGNAFSESALPTAAPLTGSNASMVGDSALLLLQKPGSIDYSLVPVSVKNGLPVPGFTPVDFGWDISYAFSPDRTQLAFAASGSAGCEKLCLHVLNLRTWQETLPPVPLSQDFLNWSQLIFNADASRVAVAFNDQVKLASRLVLVDLAQGKITQEIALSQPVFQMAFTPDGSLALYGDAARLQGSGFDVRVLLLDGGSLQAKWQQDLEMVGYSGEDQANLTDPSQGKFLSPALSFSPDNQRLYAVPADDNRLVTVNFSDHSVTTTQIQPRQSLLERLIASGVETVYAKSLNSAMKYGVLSADGGTYYLIGQTSAAVKDANGDWTAKTTPLGLQAIRISDGTELANLPGEATELNLSIDGKYLLLTQWLQSDNGFAQAVTDVMDTATFKANTRLNGYLQPTRLLDGSLAWLSSNPQASGGYQLSIYVPGAQNPRSQWSEPVNVFVAWIPIP